jgi:hypothetical protein
MTHPKGTAYEHDLYKIHGLESDAGQVIERRFLKRVDQLASDALVKLIHGSASDFSDVPAKSAWSRFVLSLTQRNPEKIDWIGEQVDVHFAQRFADIEANYSQFRKPTDPPTFAEYMSLVDPIAQEKAKAILLQKICDLPTVGTHINNMWWHVIELTKVPHAMLTSDRPVVMTNGIGYPTSYIILPISPWHLFLAVNSVEMEQELRISLADGYLFEHINHAVVSQAQKYVYATDSSLLAFVEARLRQKPAANHASDFS